MFYRVYFNKLKLFCWLFVCSDFLLNRLFIHYLMRMRMINYQMMRLCCLFLFFLNLKIGRVHFD